MSERLGRVGRIALTVFIGSMLLAIAFAAWRDIEGRRAVSAWCAARGLAVVSQGGGNACVDGDLLLIPTRAALRDAPR